MIKAICKNFYLIMAFILTITSFLMYWGIVGEFKILEFSNSGFVWVCS